MAITYANNDSKFKADLKLRDPMLYRVTEKFISGASFEQIVQSEKSDEATMRAYLNEPSRVQDIRKILEWWVHQPASYGMIPTFLDNIIPNITSGL